MPPNLTLRVFFQFRAFWLYFGTDAYFAFLSFKEYPLIAGLYSDVDSRGDGGAGGAVWFRSVADPDSVPRGAAIRYSHYDLYRIRGKI